MTNPIAKLRDKQARSTDDYVAFFAGVGLPVKGSNKPRNSKDKGEQLSADIRSRCRHGVPVKGASHGRHDPRREGLAAVVALNEPILVRKGTLRKVVLIKKPPLGWAARAAVKGPVFRTKAQKRKARRNRK